MDFAYTFGDPSTVYLNVTNRCTNRCDFCVRNFATTLGSGTLHGGPEPRDSKELLGAVAEIEADAGDVDEIVWCGFGEPTFRLDLIVEASPIFRKAGKTVRLNTNGHACLIHGRDVLPELAAAVDIVSISLNAPNETRYLEVCRSLPTESPPSAWEAMLDFLTRAPDHFREVHASVVGHVLTDAEVEACEELALGLGCDDFRIR